MRTAYIENEKEIYAEDVGRGTKGTCPECKKEVMVKSGPIIEPYWAHKVKSNCPGSKGKTKWHKDWQNLWDEAYQEVIIKDYGKRSDVCIYAGERRILDRTEIQIAYEFQHSSITIDEILLREKIYNKMVWVVDAYNFEDNISFQVGRDLKNVYYEWKHPRKIWYVAMKPVVFEGKDFLMIPLNKLIGGRRSCFYTKKDEKNKRETLENLLKMYFKEIKPEKINHKKIENKKIEIVGKGISREWWEEELLKFKNNKNKNQEQLSLNNKLDPKKAKGPVTYMGKVNGVFVNLLGAEYKDELEKSNE